MKCFQEMGATKDICEALLLRDWYEIIALYDKKSILTDFSACRRDKRVPQKSKITKIKFLSRWGMLEALDTSRNLEI